MSTKNINNTFVVGDVHGSYYTLLNLLKQLPLDAKIIFVGDLCDKGNYSKDVIELVINNNYQCVKGNHEHLFEKYILDAVEKNIHSAWSSDKRYGGVETIKSYNNDIELIKKHLSWIQTLPMYIEKENYFITHGFALEHYEHRDNQNYYNDFLLNRYYKGDSVKKSPIINIFGHCSYDEVVSSENFFCIDTSCSYGKKLTAIELKSHRIYEEPMDHRDSHYKVRELTLKEYDVDANSFESLASLVIDEDSKYGEYDLVSIEILEKIVQKYGELGKKELIKMQQRSQVFPKQIKKVLGDEYAKNFNF